MSICGCRTAARVATAGRAMARVAIPRLAVKLRAKRAAKDILFQSIILGVVGTKEKMQCKIIGRPLPPKRKIYRPIFAYVSNH